MRARALAVLALSFGLLVPWAEGASASDTSGQCGFSSVLTVYGTDGGTRIASYSVRASWCVDRTVTTTSSTSSRRGRAHASGRKHHKHKKSNGNNGGGSGGGTGTTTLSCITNFQMTTQATPMASGVVFRSESVSPASGDACSSRSYRITGKFYSDYVDGVPSSLISRDSQTANVPETSDQVEVYPAGRIGPFDIGVTFTSAGTGICSGCSTDFAFCDARLYSTGTTSSTRGCVSV